MSEKKWNKRIEEEDYYEMSVALTKIGQCVQELEKVYKTLKDIQAKEIDK